MMRPWPAVVLLVAWTSGRLYYLIWKEQTPVGKFLEILLILWGAWALVELWH